jgi:hypothetical protein
MAKLVAPVTYQGGKSRLANQICNYIGLPYNGYFYDLCCGSGAISIEAVNRGQDPLTITMVDAGPWGKFWREIGEGSFDLLRLYNLVQECPKDLEKVKGWLEKLKWSGEDSSSVFLMLQAGSFGGGAVWIENQKWRANFRGYWKPTETSNRRSPVNPMMPMPETVLRQVCDLAIGMKGGRGLHSKIEDLEPFHPGICYLDPPYENTSKYGYALNVQNTINRLNMPCYVSEGKPLSEVAHLISEGRFKGGMNGKRKTPNEEWLSFFPLPK